jgi:hypothetical protein
MKMFTAKSRLSIIHISYCVIVGSGGLLPGLG